MAKKFKSYAVETRSRYEKYNTISEARIAFKYAAICCGETDAVLYGINELGWCTELQVYGK